MTKLNFHNITILYYKSSYTTLAHLYTCYIDTTTYVTIKLMNESDDQSNWQFTSDTEKGSEYVGEEFGRANGVPLPKIEPVNWSASEYISHEKSASWYLILFAFGVVATAIVYLVTKDIFASVAILLGCVSMGIYAGRKPSVKNYTIHEKGIQVDEIFHSYAKFRSFSIVEEGAIDSIWLKPFKRVSPTVVMYFSPDEEQKIVDVIANYLPHEQRELDVVDRFSKKIRF
jgi:hypothetical protein